MTVFSSNPSTGIGPLSVVPAGTTVGTPLGTMPPGAVGVRLYLPAGSLVSFTIAATQPTAAPSAVFTVSQAGTGPNWDEALAGGQMLFVTASSGGALFRWF